MSVNATQDAVHADFGSTVSNTFNTVSEYAGRAFTWIVDTVSWGAEKILDAAFSAWNMAKPMLDSLWESAKPIIGEYRMASAVTCAAVGGATFFGTSGSESNLVKMLGRVSAVGFGLLGGMIAFSPGTLGL